MIEEHLNRLIEIGTITQGTVGINVQRWARNVFPNNELNANPPNVQFSRTELFAYCGCPDTSGLDATISILAWGGMRINNARRFFAQRNTWLPIIQGLRSNSYPSRKCAFKEFQSLREAGNLKGMGIAYYTKLICFLAPNLRGYILDQWTGKSINLLTGLPMVSLSDGLVNDTNNSTTYEAFCCKVNLLGDLLGINGYTAEERIFSEGRGRGEWRNYLIAQIQN